MYIVQVFLHVKPDKVAEFETATVENARKSVKEPLVARFDLARQLDDPTRFILIEIYRSAEGHAQHRATSHYKKWQEVAEPLMVEPRTRIICENVFPEDSGWG